MKTPSCDTVTPLDLSRPEHMCQICNRNTSGCHRVRLRDNGKFVASMHAECAFRLSWTADVITEKPSNLTTFANETLLLTLGRESLVEVDCALPSEKGRRMFVAITRDGFRTDYPVCHFAPENRVYWNNPEWFSKRFRQRVARKISRICRERGVKE